MRKASALTRFVASGIAVTALLGGYGQAPAATTDSGAPSPVQAAAAGAYQAGRGDPIGLPAGSVYSNPASGRDEVVVPDMRHTALLIGDSQSEPTDGWPRLGLAAVGYKVHFCGLGGTGFVASNGKTGNYIDALQRGDWKLPYGTPALIVIQGGGNDAARGATDAQIVANADRLIAALKDRYPGARMAMIGTLARGANYGGGRRTQVDALLGTVAARHGLPFVGVGDWLSKYSLTKNLADAVHMDAAGRRSLGGLLETRLRQLGLEGPALDGTVPATASALTPAD
ncbi:SGNH/GDSL hydrolase family protein [Pseudarthrobacter sp. AB1]|uniref:SGNH/GDSL hydrolase family protein n=1 Tax=Pseudarthrobacter sp. AB1 TaxID=2138309 RepID=UPI00186B7A49|nr:SGNH/GDSL hydrolase family protein [Pseudarthrobacter sp. AB1]MBE4719365.1 GDSL family lipase [Pseudarthrobacter sp. AB1]